MKMAWFWNPVMHYRHYHRHGDHHHHLLLLLLLLLLHRTSLLLRHFLIILLILTQKFRDHMFWNRMCNYFVVLRTLSLGKMQVGRSYETSSPHQLLLVSVINIIKHDHSVTKIISFF